MAPATGEGGKGLGLAIVKRIVELHGGTVAVRQRARARARGCVLALPQQLAVASAVEAG